MTLICRKRGAPAGKSRRRGGSVAGMGKRGNSMKRYQLITCFLLLLGVAAPLRADSFIMEADTRKKLYRWDGTYLSSYSNGRKLFKWDGQYISHYSNGRKLYRWDGIYLAAYGNGRKLHKWDGKHVMSYGNGRKLFKWEGQDVKAYGNGRKLLRVEGVIPVALVIALVTGQI